MSWEMKLVSFSLRYDTVHPMTIISSTIDNDHKLLKQIGKFTTVSSNLVSLKCIYC